MNPLSLKATNLRTYPAVDWQIPEGISAIVGPNGAGKSTLLGAVELALFADGARDLAPALGPFGERLEILLEFEHGGHDYRVRRSYSGAGRGKVSLDFERQAESLPEHSGATGFFHWEPLARESARETQALIERTLGLSRETFNASAYIAQGNSAAFCEAAPAERKAILGEILDPRGLWPAWAERAAAERKALEAELAGAEARMADRAEQAREIESLDEKAEDCSAGQYAAQRFLDDADEALASAQAALAASAAAQERLRAARQAQLEAENRRDNARDALCEAQAQAEQLPGAQAALATLRARSAEVPELERKAQAQSKALAEQALARGKKAAAEAKAEQLGAEARTLAARSESALERIEVLSHRIDDLRRAPDDTERCEHCKQLLGAEARQEALATLRHERDQLLDANDETSMALEAATVTAVEAKRAADAIEIPDADLADYSAPLAAARKAGEERAALEVAIAGYEREAARIPALKADLAAAEARLAGRAAESASLLAEQQDSAELERAAASARDAQRAARGRLDAAQAELIRAQEALARAKEAEAELRALQAEAAESRARLALLRLAERACGRDGIPALIAENACGSIEAEANRVLEQLPTASGTTFRVELRTQRALKSDAAALRETLDILVSDRQTTREFLTFSGGEQWRVSFALRWALARLLAGRRGAESRLLVIDEPDGLDAGGMDGLAAVLRESHGFDKVLLVSHNPLLASAFEQVVEIESDGEASRIAGAREEVGV